jgi:hypothetical protein
MSQINSFRSVVAPTPAVKPAQGGKDRQQRQPPSGQPERESEPQADQPADDGKPHLDIKA